MSNRGDVYKQAIEEFGERYQVDKSLEEMGELIQALIKYRQHGTNKGNVSEEMADVEIMLEQLKIIFANANAVERWKKEKIERLETRVAGYSGQVTIVNQKIEYRKKNPYKELLEEILKWIF